MLAFLGASRIGLQIGALRHSERIVPVQKRGESVEQGGQFFVLEQTRGDDELAGPVGNQGGIGLEQSLDLGLGRFNCQSFNRLSS